MSDAASQPQSSLPGLFSNQEKSNTSKSILNSIATSQDNLLLYPWKFTTCTEFCKEFGIQNKLLLTAVFEKIKNLSSDKNSDQIFAQLYEDPQNYEFIKKILSFPEFKTYLDHHDTNHCLPIFTQLSKRITTCAHYKKQLAGMLALFKTEPTEACLALVRFTHSVETLPEGEDKIQLHWLLEQTRLAWYQENYLVKHALASPFLEAYLNTHPRWAPCVDSILELLNKNTPPSSEDWGKILLLTHYNSSLFCHALSQSVRVNKMDLALFDSLVTTRPESLENLLTLTQHHEARFSAWAQWVKILPQHAGIIFAHWQNHLSRLVHLTESAQQETALRNLILAKKNGVLALDAENVTALEKLLEIYHANGTPALTCREKEKLPQVKRNILSEMLLLSLVKTTCWTLGAGLYTPGLIYEIYNQKIAPRLGTPKTRETGFDPAFYGMYSMVGRPFSGNRIFEYTGQESFKKTFLNGFKLLSQPKIGKQYFEHLNKPTMTDAEFYERVLNCS